MPPAAFFLEVTVPSLTQFITTALMVYSVRRSERFSSLSSSSGSRVFSTAMVPAMPPTFMSASTVPRLVQPSILPSFWAVRFSDSSSKMFLLPGSLISSTASSSRLETTLIWSLMERRLLVRVLLAESISRLRVLIWSVMFVTASNSSSLVAVISEEGRGTWIGSCSASQ